ncbi:uncharacterized protein N7515_009801 [Penicillium bovifimosum]|uniref:Protein kinase domain-containing protein n=1 Tax=Penicillium bovifimosum TaxID=126998 RepID=A0A9W9KUV1_9EURO|nr:uncharacterized protein N7515_009801 [Penicillium bovifimosum]KAJ5120413.1 hypothetical protein N7515_009801 [Penicillium bovifimosum]
MSDSSLRFTCSGVLLCDNAHLKDSRGFMRFVCPYAVGNVIKFHVKTPGGLEATAVAEIIKVFEPFTLSSVVLVRMACSSLGLEGDMILKLFDRRFATQLRQDEKIRPWTPDIETEYYQFILDGGAAEFVTQLKEEEDSDDEDSDDEASDDEASDDEHSDYEHSISNLKEIQGTDIPKFLASTLMPIPFPGQTNGGYTDVPGILLQYIEGFPLTDVEQYAPRESWQAICQDAIRIIHRIGDLGILNEDVKTRNFIVREDAGNAFKVTMIDFALCKFRQDYQDDYDWDKWKSIQDEEGAVGYVMQRRLKDGFSYCRSARYEKLDEEFRKGE